MRRNKKKHINFLDGLSADDLRDSDADGLSDSKERRLGTNPYNKDTDRDGLNDFEEVYVYGTDPLDPDTDKDGMSDGEEVRRGRNPKGPGKLKDLFLAHEGNDYRPHAFHPKRLVFYSVSAIGIKVLVVAIIMIFPLSAWLTPDILSQKSQEVIALTNQFRTQEGAPRLGQNAKLQQSAREKCRHMLVEQYFDHVGPEGNSVSDWLKSVNYPFSVAGENLAMGFSRPEELVQAWKESQTHRDNLLDTDYKEIGVAMMSGVYKGGETTLAAQHFGTRPQAQTASETQPDKQNMTEPTPGNPEPEQEETSSPAPPAEDPAVESSGETKSSAEDPAERATTSLPRPVLKLSVPDLTNQRYIEAEISAPEAEKIRIYAGDKVLKSLSLGIFKNITTEVELAEGKNRLRVESVKGERATSSPVQIVKADLTPPELDYSATELTVDTPSGKDSIIVKAEASLSSDTSRASIGFGGRRIQLSQTGPNTWEGQEVLPRSQKKEVFDPVVPATLTATDHAGTTVSRGLGWDDIKPLRTSLLKQYFFLKSLPSKHLKPLLDISSIYYSILLALACLILAANIIIDIRRQKGHVVLSAVGFSALLLLLIIL